MPDQPTPAPTPGATPTPPPGGPQPGQPPIGSSPATGPSQNLGKMAQGIQAAGALLKGMAMVMAMVGPETPLGQALNKSITDIGKNIPPGASTPAGENNFVKQMALRQQQMGPQQAAVAGMQKPPGAAPPPPAAPPMAA
jgi:hypothetical protein